MLFDFRKNISSVGSVQNANIYTFDCWFYIKLINYKITEIKKNNFALHHSILD